MVALNSGFLYTWSGRFKLAEWVIIPQNIIFVQFCTGINIGDGSHSEVHLQKTLLSKY